MRKSTSATIALATAIGLFALALVAAPASATQTHPFLEVFGSAEQPAFRTAVGLTVDQSSGDVLVMDQSTQSVTRYKPNGEPDPFSALGTNVIDGKGGADQTPQKGLTFTSPYTSEIAVDNSGTATDGDIYVTQLSPRAINIFSKTGAYLGQLTGFAEACGVAVDPSGAVYVGDYGGGVKKYVPAANPVVKADKVAYPAEVNGPCAVAAGVGPTAGFLFAGEASAFSPGRITKLDGSTGEAKYSFFESTTDIAVNPETGNVVGVAQYGGLIGFQEFDATGASSATRLSKNGNQTGTGVGVYGANGNIYVSQEATYDGSKGEYNEPPVKVYGGARVTLPVVTTSPASSVTGTGATLNGFVNPEGLELTECFFEWGETEAYGEIAPCAETPAEIGSGTSAVAVHADLGGLTANGTNYDFRLVAANEDIAAHGVDQSFSTATRVVTEPADGLTGTRATLNGLVNPEGVEFEECFFEWGETSSYGEITPCAETPAEIGAGAESVAVHADLTGLQPNGASYSFRLVGVSEGAPSAGSERTFETPDTVLTEGVVGLGAHQATVKGSINPDGVAIASCEFEFGLTEAYGESVPCAETPAEIGNGTAAVEVEADLSGLESSSTYHYRLVATNTDGPTPIDGDDASFITRGPLVHGESASQIGTSAATISGFVNPQGALTSYYFEYIDDAAFQVSGFAGASRQPSLDASAGSGTADTPVSTGVSGLEPGTTYHFRLLATNADASAAGPGSTFTTYANAPAFDPCPNDQFRTGPSARLPDCRAYEQASPVDKNGADSGSHPFYSEASADGDAATFYTVAGVPGGVGSQVFPIYVARRGPSGWTTRGLLPPAGLGEQATVLGWTADLRLGISEFRRYGDPTDERSAAVRDPVGGLTQLLYPYFPATTGRASFAGSSADDSKIFFEFKDIALPVDSGPAPSSTDQNLYLFNRDTATRTLVGVLPADEGGAAPAGGSFAGAFDWWSGTTPASLGKGGTSEYEYYVSEQHAISDSGDRVFFTAGDTGEVYLREGLAGAGPDTVKVSASQATTADPNGPKPKIFMQATPSGSRVLFASCEKLTDDSTAVSTAADSCDQAGQGQDLYAYDVAGGDLADLTVDSGADPQGADVKALLGASDDLSRVYFLANGDLDGAGPATPGTCTGAPVSLSGACNVYLWRAAGAGGCASAAGCVSLVSRIDADQLSRSNWAPRPTHGSVADGPRTGFVSADGQALVYRASSSQFYRFDAGSGESRCLTCNPTGAPTGSPSLFNLSTGELAFEAPRAFVYRALSGDGGRFFFQTSAKLVATDTNGVQDVYEWEALGSGSCKEGSNAYSPLNGGCLYLLSSGTGPDPSYLADASRSGDDVFIFTRDQLVPQDQDTSQDLYDVSVRGGLASQNATAAPPCSGEACRGAGSAAPAKSGAGSAVFSGPGNQAQHQKRNCQAAAKRALKLARLSKRLRRQARRAHSPTASRRLGQRGSALAKKARGLSVNAKRCRRANRGAAQ